MAAAAPGFLAEEGDGPEPEPDGGVCFLNGGNGDFRPPAPTPETDLMVRGRGGEASDRPEMGEIRGRLPEGTGEADLFGEVERFIGGMLTNGSFVRSFVRLFFFSQCGM